MKLFKMVIIIKLKAYSYNNISPLNKIARFIQWTVSYRSVLLKEHLGVLIHKDR